MATFVADVTGVVRALGPPVALVGASLGGLISLMLVGEQGPKLCWALVLVDVAPTVEAEGRQRVVDFMTARPEGFASIAEAAAEVERYAGGRERPREPDGLRKNLRLGPDGRWYWHWDPQLFESSAPVDVLDRPALERAARNVRVPTLLVKGGRSDVLSAAGRDQFLDLVPGAVSVEAPDAGHMVAGDANTWFGSAVGDFLSRHRR